MRILGIIPARYGSTRFPGKPLVDINGKPMIQRVYEGAARAASLTEIIVATDDKRIVEVVQQFGGKVEMTSSQHKTGTDRCLEALDKTGSSYDVVINIQGDEPFVEASHIDKVAQCFEEQDTEIATLIKRINSEKELFNPNKPKVLVDSKFTAIYFSRAAIPFLRGVDPSEWVDNQEFYKHIGIYGYRQNVLEEITKLPQSSLELAENLEQLRWLENGYSIKTAITETEAFSIDTPEDLEKLKQHIDG